MEESKRPKINKVLSYINNALANTFSNNASAYMHIKRNAAIQIIVFTVAFIMLVRVFPMRIYQNHNYSKQKAFSMASRESLVGDAFTSSDKKLQTVYFQEEHIFEITLYMNCNNAKEGIVKFRLYDDNFSCKYEEDKRCTELEDKGYIRVTPDLDVEKDKAYYYEVLIPEETNAQFELPVADRGALGQHENSSLFIDGIINDEVCLIADFDYTSPLTVSEIIFYDLLILLVALITYSVIIILMFIYDAYFAQSSKKIGIMLRLGASVLVAIGAIICLFFAVILNKFGGELWDRLFFLVGILTGAAWILAAIWLLQQKHKPQKAQKVAVVGKFFIIWRNYIQTVCFGLLFYALCQYVNADRLYYQRTNTRWMLIFLAIAFLMNYSIKQIANIVSLGGLVLGILGSAAYVLNTSGDEQAIMIAKLNCGVTVTWGLLIINILLSLVRKRRFSTHAIITYIRDSKNRIKVLHIILLFVFIILMFINRFEKVWVYTATLPFCAIFFIKNKEASNIRFLKNFTNGIFLSFALTNLFSLWHRPHHYWMLYRYGGLFHTVACTGMYLAIVFAAAIARLYGKLKKRKQIFAYCVAEYFIAACTSGLILLTMSKTALLSTVMTIAAIIALTMFVYHKDIKRILLEIGVLAIVCIISFPMVFTIIRTVPALINDPIRYDIEYQDPGFMLYEGDPIDSDKYMTVRRFFSVFFGRFQAQEGESANQKNLYKESDLLVYTGQGFAGIDMMMASNDEIDSGEDPNEEKWDISNGRFEIYKAYIREIKLKGHPSMGPNDKNGNEYAHAHNSYLQVAYNFGIIAGVIFIVLCILTLYRAARMFYKKGQQFNILLVPFSLFVAFNVVSLTEWAFHPCIPLGFCFILMQAFIIKADNFE